MLASELPGQTGRIQSGSRSASQGNDSPGFLTYGPYITLPAGRYKVSISYSATQGGNRWDAGKFNNPEHEVKLGAGNFPPGEGKVDFYIETKQALEGLEIRTWFDGQGTLTLNSIKIQSMAFPASNE